MHLLGPFLDKSQFQTGHPYQAKPSPLLVSGGGKQFWLYLPLAAPVVFMQNFKS